VFDFSGSTSAVAKSQRQQKADSLLDSWKQLLQDTQKRSDWLKERTGHLEELDRLKSFTFDEWRERYLQWNVRSKNCAYYFKIKSGIILGPWKGPNFRPV
jgi:hypothetical protein